MPHISIILPTYNRKRLLMRAVDSVLGQSFADFELIVVDDASEDRTKDLGVLADPPPRVSFIRLPLHQGVSAARNIGVERSQSPWICFLDSDDQWHRDKLGRQSAWLDAHGEFRICQTREAWIRNGVRVNPPKTHAKIHGLQFAENLDRCMITPSSVMMEKALFEKVGRFNESLPACEDYGLWLRITAAHPVGLVDEFLLTRYGGHADQLSSSVMGLDRFRVRSILDLLRGGHLSAGQREAARLVLIKKANIIANGYKKRGNEKEYEHYRSISARFQ